MRSRNKKHPLWVNRVGSVLGITMIFILIFGVLLSVYLYLFQKTVIIRRASTYLRKDVIMSAINFAVYDISRQRYKGVGPYNPVYYAVPWTSCGTNCYKVVYKVPIVIDTTSGSVPCNSSKARLEGGNCFYLSPSQVKQWKSVEVVYRLHGGYWKLFVVDKM